MNYQRLVISVEDLGTVFAAATMLNSDDPPAAATARPDADVRGSGSNIRPRLVAAKKLRIRATKFEDGLPTASRNNLVRSVE